MDMVNDRASFTSLIEERWQVFSASRRRVLVTALLFSTVVFCFAFSAWDLNGINDDWAMSNILSGNWPGPQGLCLFLNAALSKLIYSLNQLFPIFNWFFVLEAVTAYASYVVIVYFSLSRMPIRFAAVSIAAVTLLVVPGCTYMSNFTYVSGIAACAGAMFIYASLREERHRAPLVIWGIVFFLVSFLWRRNMFLLCIPVFGFAALGLVLTDGKRNPLPKGVLRLWPYVVVIALAAGFYVYNTAEWSQPEWAAWQEYNVARHDFADYSHYSYSKISNELESLGVSENDFRLFDNWVHEDPDFFTKERIEAITGVATNRIDTPAKALRTVKNNLIGLFTAPKLAFIFVPMLLFALGCLKGSKRWIALAVILCVIIEGVALSLTGRFPVRVKYALWTYAAVALAVGAWRIPGNSDAAIVPDSERERSLWARVYRTGTMAISAAMPVVAVGFVLFTAACNLNIEKLKATFDADEYNISSYVSDYIYEHPDGVYVLNTSTNSILLFACNGVAPYDEYLASRVITTGGWTSHSPYLDARNKSINMENPIKGLVYNEHAYYMSTGTQSADALLTYLREHYYPNATYEQVDSTTSPITSSTVYVFKFRDR